MKSDCQVLEHGVIASDRASLLHEANILVGAFVHRDTHAAVTVEKTEEEQKAYDVALKFLASQLENGPRDSETFQTKKVVDREWHPN